MTQATESRPRSRLIDRIERVDLRVTDIDRAIGFYSDVAGFEVFERSGTTALLGDPQGAPFLELSSKGVTQPAPRRATGLFHTAFRYPTRKALGHALGRLVKAGFEVGAGDHFVSEALYVDDPDGNGVELYRDRPRDEWPPPQPGDLVAMGTVALDLQGILDEALADGMIEDQAPRGTDVGHVHFKIADVDESAAFYVDVLDLDVMARMGSQAIFLASNGYHHHIGGNTWQSRGQAPPSREQAGIDRVLFAIPNEEVDLLVGRLEASGRPFETDGGRVVVRDPNDIELGFVARS